ncbi:adenosylcobinamide-GDP ribazoletransferase [Geofilum sp. OHC36d9]|uniref:adenosylcobinamide-GDP ribazoletransferase n=1 Tax=Geofilum sp. OHC36d9 TaxID=3458413 RepID=UPI00403498C5
MIKRELNILQSAFLFFTRIRIPWKVKYVKENQSLILTWFPFVGLFVGGIGAMAYIVGFWLFPKPVATILALAAMVLATGALHEDGWGDLFDAFGGGYGKDHILTIMKDSRVGAYAVIGLIFLITLKIGALQNIPNSRIPLLFVAAHALSRWPVLLVTKFWDNARPTGASKSRDSSSALSWGRITWAFIPAILPLCFFPIFSFFIVPVIVVATFLAGRYFYRHIGGYTGDCLGVVQQINEILIFLYFSFLSYHGFLFE